MRELGGPSRPYVRVRTERNATTAQRSAADLSDVCRGGLPAPRAAAGLRAAPREDAPEEVELVDLEELVAHQPRQLLLVQLCKECEKSETHMRARAKQLTAERRRWRTKRRAVSKQNESSFARSLARTARDSSLHCAAPRSPSQKDGVCMITAKWARTNSKRSRK